MNCARTQTFNPYQLSTAVCQIRFTDGPCYKVLLEPRMLICLCIVWLLSHYDGKIEYLQQKAYKPQSLKYLLSGPILKKFAESCT